MILIKSPSKHILAAIAQAHRNFFFIFSDRANGKDIRGVIVVQSVGQGKASPIQLVFNEKVVSEFPSLELASLQITYFISQVCIYGLTGLVKIHGAALAANGKALIVSANKYAGKSSLSVVLASLGYQYLTDELVLMNPTSHEIWPFPRRIALSPRAYHNLCLTGFAKEVSRAKPYIYSFNDRLLAKPVTLKKVVLLTRSRRHRMELKAISEEAGKRALLWNLFDTPPEFNLNSVDCYRLHANDLKDVVKTLQDLMKKMV